MQKVLYIATSKNEKHTFIVHAIRNRSRVCAEHITLQVSASGTPSRH